MLAVISIRIWDEKNKKMIYGNINMKLKTFHPANDEDIYNLKNEDDLKYMESAEMKDRNGKEMYEGDIFKCISKNALFIVSWHNGKWCGKGIDRTFHNLKDNLKVGTRRKEYYCNDYEVVGNIFQNKELLHN